MKPIKNETIEKVEHSSKPKQNTPNILRNNNFLFGNVILISFSISINKRVVTIFDWCSLLPARY